MTASSRDAAQAEKVLFGRRKGKALRPGQARLYETLLPRLRLDCEGPAPEQARALFETPVADTWIEIGFGGGEHLAHLIRSNPEVGLIGCEPFINGMAKMLATIERDGRDDRVRLYDYDAADVLRWLPEASLGRAYLLYPDPWPKTRHWKRRFVSKANLDALARVLRPGGLFRFASDIESYVDWTLQHLRRHPAFEWTAESASDWRQPWDGWPGTRYEAKALREGRTPAYLTFMRR